MKNTLITLLLSIALGVAILCGWRYTNALRDKIRADNKVAQIEQQLVSSAQRLTQEIQLRDSLTQEKIAIEDSLKDAQGEIGRLNLERAKNQEQIVALMQALEAIKGESLKIQQEKAQLEERLNLVVDRNIQLDSRLHSLPELKKAIRELRLKAHRVYLDPARIPKKEVKISFRPKTPKGNLGFLLKDGISTYSPKLKIEVVPSQ